MLWDEKRATIVNNESSEIIRMFNAAFDDLENSRGDAGLDFYPQDLRAGIDAINAKVYATVNNGVYRAGFATSRNVYEEAFDALFETLDDLEERLARQRYLLGERLTEADWRLFTTLLRFDPVYVGHFKMQQAAPDRHPETLGLHPRALSGAGHRRDREDGPHQAPLLRESYVDQPERHRAQGTGDRPHRTPRSRAADRRLSGANLAETLGKPSLWVNIEDPWHHPAAPPIAHH